MTEQKAKLIYKVIKIACIIIFAFFFALIVTQTIIINTKTRNITNLQNDLTQLQTSTQETENQIEEVTNNYQDYAEEELRKQDYAKDNEEVFR